MKVKKFVVSTLVVLTILAAISAPVLAATVITPISTGIDYAYRNSSLTKTAWVFASASGGIRGACRVSFTKSDNTYLCGAWNYIYSGTSRTTYSGTIDNSIPTTGYRFETKQA